MKFLLSFLCFPCRAWERNGFEETRGRRKGIKFNEIKNALRSKKVEKYCKKIASEPLPTEKLYPFAFFRMSNLFMSYLHIARVTASKKKKMHSKLSEERKKISVNRYWLQIYSNWVKKTFHPQQKRQEKLFSQPFFSAQSWLRRQLNSER